MPRSDLDIKMDQPIGVTRKDIVLWVLRVLTFLPFLFIAPALFTANGPALSAAIADVAGTGSEILLILTLLVTPIVTLTGWRWLIPMRRWYGIMFALSIITDATVAALTTAFSGSAPGRLTGHDFLIVGFLMVLLVFPLLLTANNKAQRQLGKYWKTLQRLTYVIWGLLFVHLMLLEGFGMQKGLNGSGTGPDGIPYFHQRLYQFTAVSIFLVTLRLPPVKRWVTAKRDDNKMWQVYWALSPLIVLFLVGYFWIEHEFFFKGIDLFRLHPSDE